MTKLELESKVVQAKLEIILWMIGLHLVKLWLLVKLLG